MVDVTECSCNMDAVCSHCAEYLVENKNAHARLLAAARAFLKQSGSWFLTRELKELYEATEEYQ